MKTSFVCSLAIVTILAVGNSEGAIVLEDTKEQRDFSGFIYSTLEITDDPFDFSDQDFGLLATIDSLSITLTVEDGDTAEGEFDYNIWTLGLDGVNTLLKLNGFPDSKYPHTLMFTQIPVSTGGQILANLADGELVATIIRANTQHDNYIGLCHYTHYATLKLTGSPPVPEPSTMAIWSLLGATVAGLAWWRRRRVA